jgi:peptidoglycan/xylan/chitin deacetylase (PgdA/CDA1 family)
MKPLKVRARQALGSMIWGAGRRTAAPGTLTVLMYHAVTRDPIDEAGQMSVSVRRFASQMSEVRDSGAMVVDLADAVGRLERRELDRAAVAIVFDDGFVGMHDHAAEILSRYGFASTVFVTTSWVGQDRMPLTGTGLGRPLTWAEVQALHRSGVAIGSHTHTHPRLAQLSDESMRDEIRRSRDLIAEHVGRPPEAFAYPFGSFGTFDARTRAVLAAHGFRAACTTVSGRNDERTDPLTLKRIRISWCDDEGEIRKAIGGCYDWYRGVQLAQALQTPAPTA